MKELKFTPEHEKYDALYYLENRPSDLSIKFVNELDKKFNAWKLVHILAIDLKDIITNCDNYKPSDLKHLLKLSQLVNIPFGSELPQWYHETEKYNHNSAFAEYPLMRLLNSKLWQLQYTQSPSFNRKHYDFLKDNFGIERVYQLLQLDVTKLKEYPIMGKKIGDIVAHFKRHNGLDEIAIIIG